MSSMEPNRQYLQLRSGDEERAFKSCRKLAAKEFAPRLWTFMNLPGEHRDGLNAILYLIKRGMDIWGQSPRGAPTLNALADLRDDLNDAFNQKFVTMEFLAVAKTVTRFEIPKQFLFDYLEGIDHAIRFGQPASLDDVLILTSRLGGSPLIAAIKVMGITKSGYEIPAIYCGQALLMTEWLINCRRDSLNKTAWLSAEDMASTGCGMRVLAADAPSKPVAYLVRLYAQQIENLFNKSVELIPYLGYDSSRVIRGMIGTAWKALVKMRQNPECLFEPEGPLSRKDLFGLKARYLLGLAPEMPFLVDQNPANHH